KRVWKSWAPPNCKFFVWLAINNKCWTSNRLAKRGLPHQPACPFCDQAEESINHLLSACVLSREVWTWILRELRLDVWSKAVASLDKELRKGFNSLVILILWKHTCVFDSVQPQAQAVLSQVAAKGHMWCLAGAAGLQRLLLRRVPPP
ncbi:LOW QUALITY PROTEIN: hypothetical protein U9M48_013187, partial [Paspalum notatum var. saurae]